MVMPAPHFLLCNPFLRGHGQYKSAGLGAPALNNSSRLLVQMGASEARKPHQNYN